MSYGFEVYKANGDILLSSSDNIERHQGIVTGYIDYGAQQYFAWPGMLNNGEWLVNTSAHKLVPSIYNGGFYILYIGSGISPGINFTAYVYRF